jgi:hypothetical protein
LCNWISLHAPARSGSEDRKFWTFGTIKEAHEKYQEDALKAQLPRRSIPFFSIFAYCMGVKKLRFDKFIFPICAAGLHKEPVPLLEEHKQLVATQTSGIIIFWRLLNRINSSLFKIIQPFMNFQNQSFKCHNAKNDTNRRWSQNSIFLY